MRKFIAAVMAVAALAGATAPTASAHDITCSAARSAAGHPNANCYTSSANHAWLWFPWHQCQEHVYWSHGGWPFYLHTTTVVHCNSWSH